MRMIGAMGLVLGLHLRQMRAADALAGGAPDALANMVTVGTDQVSLADIAGINMDTVQEVRFEVMPIGNYLWKGDSETGIKVVDQKQKGTDTTIKVGVIQIIGEVVECYGAIMKDATGAIMENPPLGDLVTRKHQEAFFIKDAKAIGRAKALLKDAGIKVDGRQLQECLADFAAGHLFRAPIRQQKDKDDADKVYAHFDLNKIQPAPAG